MRALRYLVVKGSKYLHLRVDTYRHRYWEPCSHAPNDVSERNCYIASSKATPHVKRLTADGSALITLYCSNF